MKKALKYKDVFAMPGSELYKFLSEGKTKETEESYVQSNRAHKELMKRYTNSEKGNENFAKLTSFLNAEADKVETNG